jgi:hypothetical protein
MNAATAESLLPGTISLWDKAVVPKVAGDPDGSAVELGTKFRADVGGKVAGVRFYKARANRGVHTGHLWRSDGSLLASVTFGQETTSGWQTARFGSPVAIAAGETYVISYHTDVGHYAGDNGYFADHTVDSGPLHGLADGTDGPNGVYHYGGSAFPTDSWRQTNYWVDVLFVPDAPGAIADAAAPPPGAIDAGSPPPPAADAAPAPTPAPSSSDPCAAFPRLPAVRPSDANTGVPSGTTLTASGTITVTTPGTVIDAKNVTGSIFVNANDVTIENTKVTMDGGYFGIRVADGVTGTKILHSEITTPNGGYTGILIANGTVCACNISRWENGATIGAGTIMQANYIHALEGDATGHFDAIEHYSGDHVRVYGNVLLVNDSSGNWRSNTGALNITTEWSGIDDVDVRGNVFGGGSYTLYVRVGSSGRPYTNVNIQDNRWIRDSARWGTASIEPYPVTWSGNVWDDDGQPLSE